MLSKDKDTRCRRSQNCVGQPTQLCTFCTHYASYTIMHFGALLHLLPRMVNYSIVQYYCEGWVDQWKFSWLSLSTSTTSFKLYLETWVLFSAWFEFSLPTEHQLNILYATSADYKRLPSWLTPLTSWSRVWGRAVDKFTNSLCSIGIIGKI